MATTSITMRIDEHLKTDLQTLVSDWGMDVTTFFTMVAKQAIREQALPFHVGERFNEKTARARWEVEFMQAHPEIPWKTYDDVDSMFEEVLSEQ